MQKFDLHTHTTYSDGHNTPEEMILKAIELGLEKIGISDHSYTSCDESYCMMNDKYDSYIKEINELKEKYKDKIEVLCGIEQDYYGDIPADAFDYSIGSVHYIKFGDDVYAADHIPELLIEAADKHCDGDIYTLIEEYYRTVGDIPEKLHPDIIGHFDVITKFIEKTDFIDTTNERYIAAWKKAADKIIKAGIPFEINTGAISRGVRTTPYPADDIREYIVAKGGKLLYSSDAHRTEHICYLFK